MKWYIFYVVKLSYSFCSPGLSSKVDYFKSLGIKQISLSSILKSNPEDVKGSEVMNFTEIHPTYGTMEDFKDLIAKFKASGIVLVVCHLNLKLLLLGVEKIGTYQGSSAQCCLSRILRRRSE